MLLIARGEELADTEYHRVKPEAVYLGMKNLCLWERSIIEDSKMDTYVCDDRSLYY